MRRLINNLRSARPGGAAAGSLARTVLGGTSLIAVAGGINKLLTLISAPILTRALGPAPYGVVALLGTATSLAATLALLGMDMAYARFFFSENPAAGAAAERFCWRFTLASGAALALLSGLGWYLWSGAAGLDAGLAGMVVAGVVLAVLGTMASTRQRLHGAYVRIAVSIITAGFVGTALSIALALYWRKDPWALLVGAAGGLVAGLVVVELPPAGTVLRPSGLSRGVRSQILRLGLAGAVSAPMYWLMSSADRWFIGLWLGPGPLGVYAFATGVGLAGMMVNSAITLTFFPEMTRDYETCQEEAVPRIGRLWARLAASLLVVWLAVTAAGGDVIRLLATPVFHEGARYVPWLAGGVLFAGLAALSNTGLVLCKNLTPSALWWLLGAILNVTLNFFLVRPLGAYGAAVAGCLSYAVIAAGAMGSAQSRFRLPVPWGRLGAAAALVLAAGVALAPWWSVDPLRSLLLKAPAGIAVSAAVAWIVAPDWTLRLLRQRAS